MAQVTLQHSLVNSGTAVKLESVNVGFSWKNLNEAKPIPGKFDIVETENGGFENPKITLKGHIDIDDIQSGYLTQDLLTSLAIVKSETPITLTVETGASTTALKGRPSAGYSTDGSNTLTTTIKFIIDSFDITLSNNSDLAHLWNFSIIGKETL